MRSALARTIVSVAKVDSVRCIRARRVERVAVVSKGVNQPFRAAVREPIALAHSFARRKTCPNTNRTEEQGHKKNRDTHFNEQ